MMFLHLTPEVVAMLGNSDAKKRWSYRASTLQAAYAERPGMLWSTTPLGSMYLYSIVYTFEA